MKSETPVPVESRLLLDAAGVADLLGISRSKVYSLYATGELAPLQVRLGGRRMWKCSDIELFVSLNCPPRDKWLELLRTRRAAEGGR